VWHRNHSGGFIDQWESCEHDTLKFRQPCFRSLVFSAFQPNVYLGATMQLRLAISAATGSISPRVGISQARRNLMNCVIAVSTVAGLLINAATGQLIDLQESESQQSLRTAELISVLESKSNSVTTSSFASTTSQDSDPIDPEAVRRAINRGVDYLKNRQLENGSWPMMGFDRGTTALCLLALLNALDDPDDPAIKKGIANLLAMPRNKDSMHYVISLRIMVLAAADPAGEKYRREIGADVELLLKNQYLSGAEHLQGGWGYNATRISSADSSNSQFVLLALHDAARVGVEIPAKHWKRAAEYWLRCQEKSSGGFIYTPRGGAPSHSMTCAGISSWVIIQDNLADVRELIDGDFAKCCAALPSLGPAEEGLNWLARSYTVRRQGYPKGIYFYYLYGLERVGRLTGLRYIGAHDWYRDGIKEILRLQNRLDGSWVGSGMGESSRDVSTAFALLFLSKGKRPVVISQYHYGADQEWNRHPQGVHYLTQRLENQWKTKLNWQTVSAESATADDLSESPILFLSGTSSLNLDDRQKQNLKLYLENGGFLFAEACEGEGCGEAGFDTAFRALLKELFPASELETIEPSHPIWSAHYPLLPNPERPLLGLTNCCRTVVVYCPKNLSCYWQLARPAAKKVASDALQHRIEYCLQLGTNVTTYATGRSLRDKGENAQLAENQINALSQRVIEITKLNHGGGADEAKNALLNLMLEGQKLGLRLKPESRLIPVQFDQLVDYPLVFMHGTSRFQFTPQERSDLRAYLEAGGFIFADSVCSSPEFTSSFRQEIQELIGPLQLLTPSHEIWSNQYGGAIDQVTLRIRDSGVAGGFRTSLTRPEFEGVEINGKLAVLFSPYDLSCAWESRTASQCTGYSHEDAIKLGIKVILYTLSR
jgi:hypothetical protein